MRRIGLVRILGRKAGRMRDLAVAAIVARIIDPASKPVTAQALSPETALTSLGAVLDLGPVTGNEMLANLDWLLKRQHWIEKSLAYPPLRPWATTATAGRAGSRSPADRYTPPTAVRLRWRSFPAAPGIPPRRRPRWPGYAPASA